MPVEINGSSVVLTSIRGVSNTVRLDGFKRSFYMLPLTADLVALEGIYLTNIVFHDYPQSPNFHLYGNRINFWWFWGSRFVSKIQGVKHFDETTHYYQYQSAAEILHQRILVLLLVSFYIWISLDWSRTLLMASTIPRLNPPRFSYGAI